MVSAGSLITGEKWREEGRADTLRIQKLMKQAYRRHSHHVSYWHRCQFRGLSVCFGHIGKSYKTGKQTIKDHEWVWGDRLE